MNRSELVSQIKASKKPSLLRALISCFGGRYCLYGLVNAFEEVFVKIALSLLLGQFVLYFSADGENITEV